MTPIHGYTEISGAPYPGYISISEMNTDDDPNKIVVTVRQQGHLGMKQASIVQSKQQLLDLAVNIYKFLNENPSGL